MYRSQVFCQNTCEVWYNYKGESQHWYLIIWCAQSAGILILKQWGKGQRNQLVVAEEDQGRKANKANDICTIIFSLTYKGIYFWANSRQAKLSWSCIISLYWYKPILPPPPRHVLFHTNCHNSASFWATNWRFCIEVHISDALPV